MASSWETSHTSCGLTMFLLLRERGRAETLLMRPPPFQMMESQSPSRAARGRKQKKPPFTESNVAPQSALSKAKAVSRIPQARIPAVGFLSNRTRQRAQRCHEICRLERHDY